MLTYTPPRPAPRTPRYRGPVTFPAYRLGMAPANKGNRYPAEVYTTEQVKRVLAACPRNTGGQRNRALIVVLWRSGLRIAEALALIPRDVDLERGTITIRHGKGNKRRAVGMDPEASAVIELWLERRRELEVGPMCPVFCVISAPTKGKALNSAYVREAFKGLALKSGLAAEGVRFHPHGLRHTFASNLQRRGVNVRQIQQLLGHSSLATTEGYLHELEPYEAIRAMQALTWDDAKHGGLAAV